MDSIESFFLIEGYNTEWNVWVVSVVYTVSEKVDIVVNMTIGYAAALVAVNNTSQHMAQTNWQSLRENLVVAT